MGAIIWLLKTASACANVGNTKVRCVLSSSFSKGDSVYREVGCISLKVTELGKWRANLNLASQSFGPIFRQVSEGSGGVRDAQALTSPHSWPCFSFRKSFCLRVKIVDKLKQKQKQTNKKPASANVKIKFLQNRGKMMTCVWPPNETVTPRRPVKKHYVSPVTSPS